MAKANKIAVKIALALIFVGLSIGLIGLFAGAKFNIIWDEGKGLKVADFSKKTISDNLDDFNNISIDISHWNIELIKADKPHIEIEYYSEDVPLYPVKGGTLNISETKEPSWQRKATIGLINMQPMKAGTIKVYYSTAQMDEVSINTAAGNIRLKDALTANRMLINSSYGNVSLTDCTANQVLSVDMDSGAFEGKGLSTPLLEFENNYGNAKFNDSSFVKSTIDMSAGRITFENCSLLESVTKSSYGNIIMKDCKTIEFDSIPNNELVPSIGIVSSSGDINISGQFDYITSVQSSYGSVKVNLPNQTQDSVDLKLNTSYGDIRVNGENKGNSHEKTSENFATLQISADAGDISVDFKK